MKIFGLRSILRILVLGICVILFFRFINHQKFVSNPVAIVGPVTGAILLIILQIKIIAIKDNVLRTYNVWTLITRRPKWLLISELKKMNITYLGLHGGGKTFINLMSRNDEVVTIGTWFLSADIRALERFMMEKGIKVQNPEK